MNDAANLSFPRSILRGLPSLRQLDELLRGERIATERLKLGIVDFSATLSLKLTTSLAAIYGATMGLFARSSAQPDAGLQILASAVKMPALFLLTLVVTFPALYVFAALSRSRLRFLALLRLLLASIVVMVAVSASFAPILAFFTLSTTSYSFMVLLNVVLLGTAGLIGLGFLRRALNVLMDAADKELTFAPPPQPAPSAPAALAEVLGPGAPPTAIVRPRRAALQVVRVWLMIYGLVGVQMSWLLRPFIGRPDLPFTWFRPRQASFFQSVFEHLVKFFGG
jgi:hypothetical protein